MNFLPSDSPFGVIPIVEFVDENKKVSGSTTLARYFAEEYGMLVFPSQYFIWSCT